MELVVFERMEFLSLIYIYKLSCMHHMHNLVLDNLQYLKIEEIEFLMTCMN